MDYGTITLSSMGYYSLKTDGLSLAKVKMASISSYQTIEPVSSINVYADGGAAYIFGQPGTVISGLRVRFWNL